MIDPRYLEDVRAAELADFIFNRRMDHPLRHLDFRFVGSRPPEMDIACDFWGRFDPIGAERYNNGGDSEDYIDALHGCLVQLFVSELEGVSYNKALWMADDFIAQLLGEDNDDPE